MDLIEFAGLNLTDTTNFEELLNIKEIDSNGLVKDLETDRAARAFKQKMTTKESTRLPFLEIQNSDEIVVVFQGKGYGGPIWALALIDTQKQTIEKLSLDHSAESDGYGAAMTYSSFENQFVDRDLSLDEYNFGLKQNDKMLIEGIHEIDGLAGATETGNAVIEMINNGIKSYEIYLKQHKE